MNKSASVAAVLASVALSVGVPAMSAQAAPPADMHCPDHSSSTVTKIELGGSVTHLDLPEGTLICVKAGTQNTGQVVVGHDGYDQTSITNKRGIPLAISYYVVYDTPEEPCVPTPQNSGVCS